jgi:hypothetical protein
MEINDMKKSALLLLLFSVFPCWLKAQEAIMPEKKIYISPEGKTFVNRSLPVYIRMSTSPDSPDKALWLKEANKSSVASPFYFQQEGYNCIRHPWAVDTVTKEIVYPKQDVVFEVYADSRPPRTAIRYGTGKTFVQSGRIFVNGSATVTLEAADELSGVETIYYSLDGKRYSIYSLPVQMNEEREYLLTYFSVDHVGNAEKQKEVRIFPDLSAPHSTCEVSGDRFENVLSGRSKILLKAEDKGMGVEKILYRIDSSTWRNYQLPVNAGLLKQGDHTLTYYAMDLTGNREEERTFAFTIDKTPPVMVQEMVGKSFISGGKEYASGKTQVKLTTFDNKAGVKEVFYSVNDAAFVRYEKPFYPADVKGDLNLKAYALDNVGNRSEITGQGESLTIPYFDLSGPTVSHAFTGPVFIMRDTVFISARTGVVLKATDSESGINRIEYAVDNSETMPYSTSFSLEKEGLHTLEVTAYDNVENTGHSEFNVKLDNTGPEISVVFSIRPFGSRPVDGKVVDIFPLHAVIFLSCTDALTGFDAMFYSLNGATEKRYTAPIGSFISAGIYTLKIRALDKLGNESLKEILFGLEK